MSEGLRWCAGCGKYVPEWPHEFVGEMHLADVCPKCKAALSAKRREQSEQ